MIRSRTVNTIHELAAQGKSIQDIAITLGLARKTVRKYLRHPELSAMPPPRPNRRSKLDPYKEQIQQWVAEDHCYNCEAMLPRLVEKGYTGSLSVLKAGCRIPGLRQLVGTTRWCATRRSRASKSSSIGASSCDVKLHK